MHNRGKKRLWSCSGQGSDRPQPLGLQPRRHLPPRRRRPLATRRLHRHEQRGLVWRQHGQWQAARTCSRQHTEELELQVRTVRHAVGHRRLDACAALGLLRTRAPRRQRLGRVGRLVRRVRERRRGRPGWGYASGFGYASRLKVWVWARARVWVWVGARARVWVWVWAPGLGFEFGSANRLGGAKTPSADGLTARRCRLGCCFSLSAHSRSSSSSESGRRCLGRAPGTTGCMCTVPAPMVDGGSGAPGLGFGSGRSGGPSTPGGACQVRNSRICRSSRHLVRVRVGAGAGVGAGVGVRVRVLSLVAVPLGEESEADGQQRRRQGGHQPHERLQGTRLPQRCRDSLPLQARVVSSEQQVASSK